MSMLFMTLLGQNDNGTYSFDQEVQVSHKLAWTGLHYLVCANSGVLKS